jgi:uncharacterized metal-binding protein
LDGYTKEAVNGKQHAKVTATLALVSVAVCYRYDFTQYHSLGVAAGLFLHPDMDIDAGNITNSYIRNVPVIGSVLESVWSWYWKPYAVFAKHRGLISHSLILSTMIRLLYALWWLVAVPGAHFYYAFAVGLMASDAAHIVMDMFTEFVDGFRLWKNR